MGQYITGILTGIKITDIIDIAILTFIVYQILGFLKDSRAVQLAKGIAIVLAVFLIADLCNLYALSWVITQILSVGLIAVIIVFQPELRKGLDYLGRSRLGIRQVSMSTEYNINLVGEFLNSLEYFAGRKEGAIIVIERDVSLEAYAASGTKLDCEISTELLNNIFYKGAPLHDGAVIVRGDRIYAAACVLPLTENPNLSKDLGTRHRAALGISEVSDALVLVVSEETGIISTASNGKLSRFLDIKTVEKQLLDVYLNGNQDETIIAKFSKAWEKINGKKQDS